MYRAMDINPNTVLMAPRVLDDDEEHTHPEGRTRVLHTFFNRAPNGKWLEKDRGPLGFRTPNGLVWGHTLDEIGYISRQAGLNVLTVYSRSQLKELGELYNDDEFEGPLVRPRVRRPWPVLKLPKRHPANTDPPLGAIDQGCEEEHCEDPDCRTYTMRWDEFSGDTRTAAPVKTTDPGQVCRGRLLPNNPASPLVNRRGDAYHYLWCDHFVQRFKAQKRPSDLIARTVHEINRDFIIADQTGIFVFDTPENMHAHAAMPRKDWKPVHGVYSPADAETDARYEGPLEMVLPDVEDPSEDEVVNEGGSLKANDDGSDVEMMAESNAPSDDDATGPKVPPASGLFSLEDLPKLEEFIPEGLFPDVLLVHDPQQLTNHKQTGDEPIKYKRVYPVLPRDTVEKTTSDKTEKLVAHLHLHSANQLGTGHHSSVYRAPLTLPPPLSARSRTGQCTVAAKLAYKRCTAHGLLHNEADVYNAFPKDTQEEYCGFNFVPPCHRYPVPVGAVVPKFYGFYMPVGESAGWGREHARCSEDKPCRVNWMSPILLMEECGKPVEPEKFNADQRTECFSLLLRLHTMLIRQGSFYVRNIMIQPGPLTLPPERRSFASPSFRLIDFGRGERFEVTAKGAQGEERAKMRDSFECRMRDELKCAREELLIEDLVLGF